MDTLMEGNTTRTPEWLTRILAWVVGILIIGGLSWCGWVTVGLVNRPTRDETKELISSTAPYTKDRAMIIKAVNDSQEINDKLREAIENNTKAIVQLQTTLEKSRP